jgi:molybdenum cofactor biosynthesis protein B
MVDFQRRDTRRGVPGEPAAEEDDDSTEADAEDAPESETEHEHDHHAHDLDTVGVAILTVSSTRTLDEDPSGDAIASAVQEAGHEVITRELVGDTLDGVQSAVNHLVGRADVDVVISTGGTGVTPDDVTIEAIGPLFEKTLPGFGETFRLRSAEDIGTRVIATRATAGIANSVVVFALPGSENAVTLGVEDIILPEIEHLAGLAQRGRDADEK